MFYLNNNIFLFSFSRNFTIREFEQALSEPVFVVGWDVGWVGGWGEGQEGICGLQIAGWTPPQRSAREATASNASNVDRIFNCASMLFYCYRPTTPISAGQQSQGSARDLPHCTRCPSPALRFGIGTRDVA